MDVIDPVPITVSAMDAYTLSLGPAISMAMPKQLGSASGRETQPTVSDYTMLKIILLVTGCLAHFGHP